MYCPNIWICLYPSVEIENVFKWCYFLFFERTRKGYTMGYWDDVRSRWGKMVEGDFKSVVDFNQGGKGTGSSGTGGTGSSGTGGSDTYEEWKMIHQKFRKHYGRDPYSLQELKDWWSRL